MKRSILILVIISGFSNFCYSVNWPRMLILGDSHMVGHFGNRFHVNLHNQNKFQIYSVSIGGSGSANFLYPLQNFCCGYMVRSAIPGDSLDKEGKMPWVGCHGLTNEYIAPEYKSNIDTLLKNYQPDIVVIELGSNIINAHQQLLQRIHLHAPNSVVYWIGSYARALGQYRVNEIEKVCMPLSNKCSIIRSDDVVGNAELVTYHFGGKDALRWADSIANRVIRMHNLQIKHANNYYYVNKYALLAARLVNPFAWCFSKNIVKYCAGEGILSNALRQKLLLNTAAIVK